MASSNTREPEDIYRLMRVAYRLGTNVHTEPQRGGGYNVWVGGVYLGTADAKTHQHWFHWRVRWQR